MVTYTTRNGFTKPEDGGDFDTWGLKLNTSMDLVDESNDGVYSLTQSGNATWTLTQGATDNTRKRVLNFTGGTGGTITIPNQQKVYFVRNLCSGKLTFTTATPTATAVIPAGKAAAIFCDGSASVILLADTTRWNTITSVNYASVGGTTATFETLGLEFYNELLFVFDGFSHSTAGATNLRAAITGTAASYANHVTIGSFTGANAAHGAVHLISQRDGGGFFPGSIMSVALGTIASDMIIGSSAGAIYPVRFGSSTLVGVRFDFNGATLDAGIITLLGR